MELAGQQHHGRERRRERSNTDEETRVAGNKTRQDDGTVVNPFTTSHPSDPSRPTTNDAVSDEIDTEGKRPGRRGERRHATEWTHTLPGRVRRCWPLACLLSLLKLRRFVARGARVLLGVRSQPRLARLDERSLHYRLSYQESSRFKSRCR